MSKEKLVSGGGVVFDLVLAAGFFTFMTFFIRPNVPAQSEAILIFFSLFTSACLTGVFWMALQLFRVTFVDQMRNKRK